MSIFGLAAEWRDCVSELLCRYDLPSQDLYPALAKLRDALHAHHPAEVGEAIDDLRLGLISSLHQLVPSCANDSLHERISRHPDLSREDRLLRLLGLQVSVVDDVQKARYDVCVFFAHSVGELLGHPPLRPPRGPGPGGSGVPRKPRTPRRSPGHQKNLDDDV